MSIRRKYLDRLRLFAAFLVVLMHITSTLFSGLRNVESSTFRTLAMLNQLSGIAVPLFLMVSGSLIFKKPFSRKKQFSLSIKMLILYFIFGVVEYISKGGWEIIPYIVNPFSYKRWIGIGVTVFLGYYYITSKKPLHMTLRLIGIYFFFSVLDFAFSIDKTIVDSIFNPDSYRWYLILLIGIYMIQPILFQIANDKRLLNIAIAVGFIYALCYNLSLAPHLSVFDIFTKDMAGAFAYRTIFYLLLGQYMVKFMLSHDSFRLIRVKIYAFVLIVISTLIQMNMVWNSSAEIGDFYMRHKDYFSIYIIANSLLVYTLVYSYAFSDPIHKVCGSAALYIYLYHLPVMKLINYVFGVAAWEGTFKNVMLLAIITYLGSLGLALITNYAMKLIKPYMGERFETIEVESE